MKGCGSSTLTSEWKTSCDGTTRAKPRVYGPILVTTITFCNEGVGIAIFPPPTAVTSFFRHTSWFLHYLKRLSPHHPRPWLSRRPSLFRYIFATATHVASRRYRNVANKPTERRFRHKWTLAYHVRCYQVAMARLWEADGWRRETASTGAGLRSHPNTGRNTTVARSEAHTNSTPASLFVRVA